MNTDIQASVIHHVDAALRHRPAARRFIAAGWPLFNDEIARREQVRARKFPALEAATAQLVAAFQTEQPDAPPQTADDDTIDAFVNTLTDVLAARNNRDAAKIRRHIAKRIRAINDAEPAHLNTLALMAYALPDASLFHAGRVRFEDIAFALQAARISLRYVRRSDRHAMLGTSQYVEGVQDYRSMRPRRVPHDLLGATPLTLPSAEAIASAGEGNSRDRHGTPEDHHRHVLRQWSRTMGWFSVLRREHLADGRSDSDAATAKPRRNFIDTWREILERWAYQPRGSTAAWPLEQFEALSMQPVLSDGGAATVIAASIRQRDLTSPLTPEPPMLSNDWMHTVRPPLDEATRILRHFGTIGSAFDAAHPKPPTAWMQGAEADRSIFTMLRAGPGTTGCLLDRLLLDPALTPTRRALVMEHANAIHQIFTILAARQPYHIFRYGTVSDAEINAAYAFSQQWKKRYSVTPHHIHALVFSPDLTDSALRSLLQKPSARERAKAVLSEAQRRFGQPLPSWLSAALNAPAWPDVRRPRFPGGPGASTSRD